MDKSFATKALNSSKASIKAGFLANNQNHLQSGRNAAVHSSFQPSKIGSPRQQNDDQLPFLVVKRRDDLDHFMTKQRHMVDQSKAKFMDVHRKRDDDSVAGSALLSKKDLNASLVSTDSKRPK